MTFSMTALLWCSVILQCTAVIYAWRAIPLSRRALAWTILSTAFVLMAMRRLVHLLYQEGLIEDQMLHLVASETIALYISVLIVVGVFLIRRLFIRREKDFVDLHKLSLAVDQSPSGTLITDRDGRIEYANPTFLSSTGLHAKQVTGKFLSVLATSTLWKEAIEQILHAMRMGQAWQGQLTFPSEQGKTRYEQLHLRKIQGEDGEALHFVLILQDVTEAREKTIELEDLVLRDSLTGLPNRTLFYERLRQAVTQAEHESHVVAVLLMDLDRFKEINDTLGHHVGDQLLQEIGPRIKSALREVDTVARMGGDEFLVMLPNVDESAYECIAKKLLHVLEQPFFIKEFTLNIGVSIGISLYPEHGAHEDKLVQCADVAMYAAKRAGKGFSTYNEKQDEHSVARLAVLGDLRHAIDQDELALYFHPKIHVKDRCCTGFEALVRWPDNPNGYFNPDAFVPVAEETGAIRALTHWVLSKAIEECASWHRKGYRFDIAVNLSARDFLNPDLAHIVENLLLKYELAPAYLVLELTESAIMTDAELATQILTQLGDMGVRLAIDDFGTGYSSLENLKKFPVSELKIDKSFVMDMIHDDNDAIIVRSTIDLAHNLGLKVVAEGVINRDVWDLLEILRCDSSQGFYITKPMPAKDTLDFLQGTEWSFPRFAT